MGEVHTFRHEGQHILLSIMSNQEKFFYFFFLCCISCINVAGQVQQTGIVSEYNEKLAKTPLPAVELVVHNAGSTISDKRGMFTLSFRTLRPGDKVSCQRIEKLGYEIFNQEAVDQWYISHNGTPFSLIMCKSSKFKRIRDQYNRIASESYNIQYNKAVQALRQEKAANRLQEDDFKRKMQELTFFYEEQLENLDTYVNKFARIDLSELSNQELEIIELVQAGEIDAAIKAYEKKSFLIQYINENKDIEKLLHARKTLEGVQKEKRKARDSIYASITRQVNTYLLAGGRTNIDKAKYLLKDCALSDTTNMNPIFDYANFASQLKDYDDAEKFYRICLRNTKDPFMQARISLNLGTILAQTHKFLDAEVMMLDALLHEEYIYNNLSKPNLNNLALVRANLGSLYRLVNNFDEAIKYLELADENYQQIYATAPQSCKALYAQNLMNLGITYRRIGKTEKAEMSYIKSINLYKELADSIPQKYLANLGVCQLNLGTTYYYLAQFEKSEMSFQESLKNLKKASSKNPYSVKAETGLAYNGLGLLYSEWGLNSKSQDCYQKSLAILKELYNVNPNAHQYSYARLLSNMGLLYRKLHQNEKALEYLELSDSLFSSTPWDVYKAYKEDIAKVSYNLGDIYVSNSKMAEAKKSYMKTSEILEGGCSKELRYILASSWIKLGLLTVDSMPAEAEPLFKRALPEIKDLFMKSPDEYRVDYASVLFGLVKVYRTLLTEKEEAVNDLLKYLPIAYKQYKILNAKDPDTFSAVYGEASELMKALNLIQ